MSLADLSIKRPIFISCIVFLMLSIGIISLKRLGVDLFPDITFPVVVVRVPYPGAGPAEIETLVTKPVEDELSTIQGMKRLSSISREGVGVIIAEFTLETDIKYAEQKVRDGMQAVRYKLPDDILEPVIRRVDPADQPIVILSLNANLSPAKLYDLADEVIRTKLEQVPQVGLVEILGGQKREIKVELDRKKLKNSEVSATQVVASLKASGEDIPVGTVKDEKKETVFRTLGQYKSLSDIADTIVNFFGNEVPIRVRDLGAVKDSLQDENSKSYFNGKKTLFLYAFKQTGANTVAVADAIKKRVQELNEKIKNMEGSPKLEIVRDGSFWIRINIEDVKESIIIGILLTVIVVFFYLASVRSTIITGLALPNSLIGAFILMYIAGFTINVMSLLALSLAVGLLVDDAIVVRENIFRHLEMGKSPKQAALEGTKEVSLAVIATTLCILSVFGPIGFLKGVTGQFFKQFGLTICFAMIISLFDALTMAPMLSAYFAGNKKGGVHEEQSKWLPVRKFQEFQTWLENKYENSLRFTLRKPKFVLGTAVVLFVLSLFSTKFVTKTFLPQQDAGEFMVAIDMPPGTNLDTMEENAKKVDEIIRSNPEVELTALTVGNRDGESNYSDFFVKLVPSSQRKLRTYQFKEKLREQLKAVSYLNPKVKDYDAVGAGQRPFNLNIIGSDLAQLEKVAYEVFERLKNNKNLKDVDINYRPGKPEFQVALNKDKATKYGISTAAVGAELRTLIEGTKASKFREEGREYDVRVRLKEEQRNLKQGFNETFVPNVNRRLVKLSDIATPIEAVGPSKITRQDRARYIQIQADIAPGGGLGNVMEEINNYFKKDYKLPEGMTYAFVGQAENFKELGESMATAMLLGILFIYLVLSSLYESFIIPITIMLALPLAVVGSFLALLVTRESLNIFSMIGIIMLLGIATKNSILLVDYTKQLIKKGMDETSAIILAGKTRLRPILMTSMALIAGTLPIAIGLNEASKQRTSMGVTIIGGLISSTLLTLFVVPAAFSYIDRFQNWLLGKFSKVANIELEQEDTLNSNHKPAIKQDVII
jgi:HAE1 family hydrophobic/amphiphilic exporter-1